jgi:hypothetical protein
MELNKMFLMAFGLSVDSISDLWIAPNPWLNLPLIFLCKILEISETP